MLEYLILVKGWYRRHRGIFFIERLLLRVYAPLVLMLLKSQATR